MSVVELYVLFEIKELREPYLVIFFFFSVTMNKPLHLLKSVHDLLSFVALTCLLFSRLPRKAWDECLKLLRGRRCYSLKTWTADTIRAFVSVCKKNENCLITLVNSTGLRVAFHKKKAQCGGGKCGTSSVRWQFSVVQESLTRTCFWQPINLSNQLSWDDSQCLLDWLLPFFMIKK